MVTTMVEELVNNGNKYDVCIAIGPMIMMKFDLSPYKETGDPDSCQHEPDHG